MAVATLCVRLSWWDLVFRTIPRGEPRFVPGKYSRERERDSLLSFSKNRTETTNFLFRMFEKRRQEFIPNWSDRDVKEGNKLWILIIIRPNACINEWNDYTVSLILIESIWPITYQSNSFQSHPCVVYMEYMKFFIRRWLVLPVPFHSLVYVLYVEANLLLSVYSPIVLLRNTDSQSIT